MTEKTKKQSLIEELHSQPYHVRSIMMWLSVFVTIAVIGTIWIGNTKDQLAMLTDPKGYEEQRVYALEQKELTQRRLEDSGSPFAMISKTFLDLRANIGQIIQSDKIEIKSEVSNNSKSNIKIDEIEDKKPKLPLIDNYGQ